MKKYYLVLLFLFIIFGCDNTVNHEKRIRKSNVLFGDWGYIDNHGNYIESQFNDTSFRVYNKHAGVSPWFYYSLKNDSMYSGVDKRRLKSPPIATITRISNNEVIIISKSARDTLHRILDGEILLSNTEPGKDSLVFKKAFIARYEKFLIKKGIITEEELEKFRNENFIPDDIKISLEE
ncbi:MAG: hypothetical protein K8S16_11715 [Bacteroidales bacterium]|nr:hypothetical protein [Bacteroidales bacterium]